MTSRGLARLVFMFGFGVALAGVAAGCVPSAESPAEGSPIASLHRSKCGSCHMRVEPGTHSRESLEVAFTRHQRRVPLSQDEWARMVDFLASTPARKDTAAR